MSINPLLSKGLATGLVFILLLIPLSSIRSIIDERAYYRSEVAGKIAAQWSGSQVISGPVVVLSYLRNVERKVWLEDERRHVMETQTEPAHTHLPATSVDWHIDVPTELRAYGIHAVPVYTSRHVITAQIAAGSLEKLAASIDDFNRWQAAELAIAVTDSRGLVSVPALKVNGIDLDAKPGSLASGLSQIVSGTFDIEALATELVIDVDLDLRGSSDIGVVPLAADGRYTIASEWPHPSFFGRFLPDQRDIDADGFTATWQISRFATSAAAILQGCDSLVCASLNDETLRVRLTDPVDIYLQASRATKYALLLILATFVAFFLMETLANKRLHTISYTLVGATLLVFYLLLLSLAEHIGFTAAYGIGAIACALLAAYYLVPSVGRAIASVFGAVHLLLNATLFGILRSEDHALLAGSLLVFGLLALVMVATRRVDWRRFDTRS
ncbi:MAG: cell envelope integrity protein CreD [Pseudomonadota bacterium]